MLSKQLAFGLALAAGLALTSTARAGDDLIRLALPNNSSGDVLTLGDVLSDRDADTLDVAYRYGYGGYRGGYRGGSYGGYRGYGYGGYRGYGYGGYRGYGYGGYRGGYYGGYRGYSNYYRPYYYGSYYRPRYYGAYYSPYSYSYYNYNSYYVPSYSYYSSYGYYGISDDGYADAYAICLKPRRSSTVYYYTPPQAYEQPSYEERSYQAPPQQAPQQQAPQVMPKADETYPYDGGPKNPVPMPSQAPEEDARPTVIPYGQLQPGETLVSLKPAQEKKTGKWNYPAYGEKPTRGGK